MNLIYLNANAIENLDLQDLKFTELGHGEYTTKTDDYILNEFLKANECELDFLGRIVDTSFEFKGRKWGCVIVVEGVSK